MHMELHCFCKYVCTYSSIKGYQENYRQFYIGYISSFNVVLRFIRKSIHETVTVNCVCPSLPMYEAEKLLLYLSEQRTPVESCLSVIKERKIGCYSLLCKVSVK